MHDPEFVQHLQRLDERIGELAERVDALERAGGANQPVARPASRPPASARPTVAPPPNAPPPRKRDLTEDLFGGRVLAVVGGLAVLLGVIFFLALAIRNGIIGEGMRVVLAAAGSVLLVGGGYWLHRNKGQTDASQAAMAAGIAGLFATITTATQLYAFVAPNVGLILAGLVGAGAVALAIHLDSRLVAGLGIVGALASPALVDAPTRISTLIFVVIALLAATAVVLWRKWSWLSLAAFVVSLPQLLAWVDANDTKVGTVLTVVTCFWLINLVASVGFEIRTNATQLRFPSTSLAILAATATAATGWWVLHEQHHSAGENLWIGALAFAHLAAGAALRKRGVARDITLVIIGIGLLLGAIATAMFLDGPGLVVALCAEAVLLAWVAQRTDTPVGSLLALGYFGAGIVHTLAFEAQPSALGEGVPSRLDAVIALGVVVAAAVALSYLVPEKVLAQHLGDRSRIVFLAIGATAAVFLVSILIVDVLGPDEQRAQTTLSAFWAILGLGLLIFGLTRSKRGARLAGLTLLGLAIAKIFLYDLSNLSSVNRAGSFVAVGVLLLGGAYAYQRLRKDEPDDGDDRTEQPSDADEDPAATDG